MKGAPLEGNDRARLRLRQLAGARGRRGGGLESGDLDFSRTRQSTSLDALRENLTVRVVANPKTPLDQDQADHAVVIAETALKRLADD